MAMGMQQHAGLIKPPVKTVHISHLRAVFGQRLHPEGRSQRCLKPLGAERIRDKPSIFRRTGHKPQLR